MTIDWWTLGLQTINVAVLVWLLGRFFWRPVAAMIEQRRLAARRLLDDAQAKQAQAAAALAEIERTRAGFAQEREAVLAAAQAAAEQVRAARLAEAQTEAAGVVAAARAGLETERAAAQQALAERAGRLAVDIAGRLAARLDGAAVQAAFLDWLLRELRALPDAARQAMAGEATALRLVSAAPLDAGQQEACRQAVAAAVGAAPRIAFAADPALIAGLELHGPNVVVRNSWRADLDSIMTELAHAGRT